MSDVVLGAVALAHQHFTLPQPCPGPRLVGPRQAERKVWFPAAEHLVERPAEQTVSLKPVVPVAERLDAMSAGEIRLPPSGVRQSKVVKAEGARNSRLPVATKERYGTGDVRPLRKTRTPPAVVFGYRVKLRQVHRHDQCVLPAGRTLAGARLLLGVGGSGVGHDVCSTGFRCLATKWRTRRQRWR